MARWYFFPQLLTVFISLYCHYQGKKKIHLWNEFLATSSTRSVRHLKLFLVPSLGVYVKKKSAGLH